MLIYRESADGRVAHLLPTMGNVVRRRVFIYIYIYIYIYI